MKLNSLTPNARYDLVFGKPSKFESDNDGSFLYRYSIEPDLGILDGETEEKQIGWKCREVRVWEKPTKAVLKKAIIRSVVDETAEFGLVNSYNMHVLKIKEDADAVNRYKEYLAFTEEIDSMLVSDCQSE